MVKRGKSSYNYEHFKDIPKSDDIFANYWIWHELVNTYSLLRKGQKTLLQKRKLRALLKQIVVHYVKNFLLFPIWLFKLFTPSYFKGSVTVWTNLRTIFRSPEFRPLRTAVVSQLFFCYIVFRLGAFVFYYHSTPVDAATFGWIQTSWTGGVSTTATAAHTSDRTGWTKYTSSTQANVAISPGDIKIVTSTYTTTDDGTLSTTGLASGGGFSNGVSSSIVITGSGGAAEVTLGVASAGGEIDTWDTVSYNLPATISGTEDGNGAMVTDGNDAFYIMRGGGTTGFYKFIPSTKATSTLASIPAAIPPNGGGGAMVLSGNYIYVYSGGNSGPHFYAYSILGDSWSTLTNPPSAPYGDGIGSSMATDGSGNIYFLAGGATTNFFKYTVTSSAPNGSWSSAYTVATGGRGSRVMYDSSNNAILILGGNNGHTISSFDIGASTVTNYTSAPNDPGFTSGASMVKNDTNNTVYAISGQNYAWLERLNLTSGTWASRQTSSTPASGNTVGYMIKKAGEDRIYTTFGGTSFYYLRPSTGAWQFTTTTKPIPGTIGAGATMIRNGNDEIYVLAGGGSSAIYRFAINAGTQYTTTGTLTSATIDLKYATSTVLSWTYSANAQTGSNPVKFQVAANTDNATWNYIGPDGTANTYFTTSSGSVLTNSLNGKRYYRYKAFLTTANASYTPTLSDVTFSYHSYLTSGSLISSAFDTMDATNVLASIAWTQSAPTGTSIKFQVRTSGDNVTWTSWMGPNGTSSTYFTDNTGAQSMPSALTDGTNDNWIQYQVFLVSDGTETPILQDLTFTYVVNAPPEISITTSTIAVASNGVVTVPYTVRDIDTDVGRTSGLVAISLQYCTANCSNAGGETWATAVTSSLGGEFGPNVSVNVASTTQYTTHSLTWTPTSSYNNQYNNTNFKIRLRANDSEAANNIGTAESNIFTLDTTDPLASVIIDGRSTATSTLTFSVTENTMSGLQMKVSNHSDLSADGLNINSGNWISYTSTSTWNLGTGGTTIYYQLRDAYGNISADGAISSGQTPQIPGNLFFKDISNSDTNEWREFIAWQIVDDPTPGFMQYTIYRSTDGVTYSQIATQVSRVINYYLDTAIDTGTTYYYKVTSKDNSGNISSYSTVVSDNPNGQGGTDVAAPTISNVTTSTLTPSSITVTWETDELSDSYVDYITEQGGDFSGANTVGLTTVKNTPSGLGAHSIVLTGLTPDTTYYFRTRSIDPDGNQGIGTLNPDGYSFTTLSGATISDVTTLSVLNTGATITWNTDQESDSYVVFSTSSSFTASSTVGSPASVSSHEVTLPSLIPNTTYYYYVVSGLAVDKNTVDGQNEYYSFKTTADLDAPVITFDVSADVVASDTSLNITFVTDEPATSTLNYGTSIGYGSVEVNNNLNTDHHYTLTNLLPGTLYYFSIRASDEDGNISGASQSAATTTNSADFVPPIITSVTTTVVTDDQALISWNTDEGATSRVWYSTSSTSFIDSSSLDYSYDQTHTILISGLTTSTGYYYFVVSTDSSGNTSTSTPVQSFTTLGTLVEEISDFTPPLITSVTTTVVTDDQALITWNTDESANSRVYYGTNSSTLDLYTSLDSSYGQFHALTLSTLSTSTLYYYFVVSVDSSGNRATSTPLKSFTTLDTLSEESEVRLREETARAEGYAQGQADATPPPDYVDPVISDVEARVVTDDQALIIWSTDEGTTGRVYYGTHTGVYGFSSDFVSTYNRDHGITLSALSTSTLYYYIVVSADSSGNTATSSEYSFTTLETLSEESEVQLREEAARAAGRAEGVAEGSASVQSSGGGGGASVDRTAPVISNARAIEIKKDSAIITWDTGEAGDSIVEFGQTIQYGRGGLSLDSTLTHRVPLIELSPLTTYFYRLSTSDLFGNRSGYVTGSFTTLSETAPEVPTSTPADTTDTKSTPTSTPADTTTPDSILSEKDAEELFLSSIQKVSDIIKSMSSRVSVGVLESTLFEQSKVIQELSQILPVPIISGQPLVEVGSNYATISWVTDKLSNSLVEFAPDDVFTLSHEYDQTVGQPDAVTNEHTVDVKGVKPNSLYHYRVVSRTPNGSETKSRDFTFKTKPENSEISNYKISVVSPDEASFTWVTNVPTQSIVTYTPYRNGVLSVEARKSVKDTNYTTQHTLDVSGFEGGVIYDVEISGQDYGNNITNKVIQGFSTVGQDVPPIISQIKTDSAIIPGGKDKIQIIISWLTNELSTSRVFYRKGFASENAEFSESTILDSNYTKKHITVVTNFEPGTVYQFVVESTDSSGNTSRSKPITILTPRKEQSVFQVIISNVEGMFSWVGKINK